MTPDASLFTFDEAALLLGVHRVIVGRLAAAGRLQVVGVGRQRRVAVGSIRRYLERRGGDLSPREHLVAEILRVASHLDDDGLFLLVQDGARLVDQRKRREL